MSDTPHPHESTMVHPEQPPLPKTVGRRRLPGLIILALTLVAVAWGLWQASRPPVILLQGQLDAEAINIAPKVPGRVAKVLVKEGQSLQAGDPVIEMNAPEIDAKVAQATAVRDAAQAVADKAQHGARHEEVRMAEANWRRAKAGADLAEKTFRRVDKLAAEGLLAEQKRDEAETQWRASTDLAQAARAQYDMALAGARQEDKAAADAQLRQATGVLSEAQVAEQESRLRSPVAGEVGKVFAKVGEISPAGVPVANVIDLSRVWAVLPVREDLLPRFAMKQRFRADVPALARQGVEFEVCALAVQPDFATWRSSRAGAGFDVRTFEVKACPTGPLPGARPGMSVLVRVNDADLPRP